MRDIKGKGNTMLRRLIHIDEWLSDYLQAVSQKVGIPVNELIRIGCCLNIIEFAKISGYKPAIDAKGAYLMVKGSPTEETIKKMYDSVAHEARKAAEFRITRKAIVARPAGKKPSKQGKRKA
jgi:hypothetical protein